MKTTIVVTMSLIWEAIGYAGAGMLYDKTRKQRLASTFIFVCLVTLQAVLATFTLIFFE